MAPVFDNGTSLGYEILDANMDDFFKADKMQAYISKGRHHLKWQLSDDQQCQHTEILVRLAAKFPELKNRMHEKLALYDPERVRAILTDCTEYTVPEPLSAKRADFIFHLVLSRIKTIKEVVYLLE